MAEHSLYVVGTGPGEAARLTPEATAVIASCHFFTGGRRLLELAPFGAETMAIGADLEEVRNFISASLEHGDVCVLTSGDPGCYSILVYLKLHFPEHIQVVPGISSVQMLAARLAVPWQDWRLKSVHGRGAAVAVAPPGEATVYLCDGENTPAVLAGLLLERMPDCPAVAAADLGRAGEWLLEDGLEEIAAADFPPNSLLLVQPRHGEGEHLIADAAAPGIPDELWLRAEGIPMAKSEVRSVLMGKTRPDGRDVIWDLGAGTGTYAVECSLLEPRARVIAVDKRADACELIRENAARFGAAVSTVCGEAPAVLGELPPPDLAIIGGNDGRLEEIFTAVTAALNPGGRVAVTAVLERTRKAAHSLFAGSGLAGRAVTRVSIARGSKTKWEEHNPVIIFIGDKPAENQVSPV